MPKFTTGVATGPGAVENFFQAIRTHLLANGWTEHKVRNATVGNRDTAFRSSPLDATADNCAYVSVQTGAGNIIGLTVYRDFDPTAGASGTTINSAWPNPWNVTCQDASFLYWIRANPWSFAWCVRIGSIYYKAYGGFVRRGLPANKSGITKTTQVYAAGATSMAVASDMTGKLRVGQRVMVVNYSHSSASPNKANAELVTLQAIAPGSLTFTAPTTKAYDAGALIGHNPLPSVMNVPAATAIQNGTFVSVHNLDGSFTGSGNQQSTGYGNWLSLNETYVDPSDDLQTYEMGYHVLLASSPVVGRLGFLYHWMAPANATHTEEDIFTDGEKSYVHLGTNLVLGPRED